MSLTSCATMAKNDVMREMAKRCEARGENMRIIAEEASYEEGVLLGTAVVSGSCLAPGDEGYEDAMSIEEYRAVNKLGSAD